MGIRVLHIGKYYPPVAGGVELFLHDLLHALSARGLATAALVHHDRVHPDQAHQDRVDLPEQRPAADAQPAVYRVPILGQLLYAPLSPAFPWWLARAIRDIRPQLLHLHLPNTSVFAALVLPAARRLPWVVHWHADVGGSRIDRRLALAYGLYRPFEQAVLARSRAMIATSPPYLQASHGLRRHQARCSVIPLGIAPERLETREPGAREAAEQIWGDSPGLRVLAVGRLTYYKGHEVLIDAAAQVPDARVVIAGGGERRARLAARISAARLDDRVRLAGLVPDGLLHALMASCDLLCLPSLERTEAFGLVLLEAMHFGKPVVVSDIPGSGTGWVVAQAGHGLLTRPGDAQSLARALIQLQQQPALRATLGENGREALRTRFGIDAVAARTQALYEQVLGLPAPADEGQAA